MAVRLLHFIIPIVVYVMVVVSNRCMVGSSGCGNVGGGDGGEVKVDVRVCGGVDVGMCRGERGSKRVE